MAENDDFYTNEYLASHDIDWFCMIKRFPIHAASNGGNIPDFIKNNKPNNVEYQKYVYGLDHKYSLDEIYINTEHLDRLFHDTEKYTPYEILEMKRNYLRTFVDMALRGFCSFDRCNYENYNIVGDSFEDNQYILVARPINCSHYHDRYNDIIEHIKTYCDSYKIVNPSLQNLIVRL